MTCILGVDPGLSGAIAFYFPDQPDRVAIDHNRPRQLTMELLPRTRALSNQREEK
jgi:hypothetical protein